MYICLDRIKRWLTSRYTVCHRTDEFAGCPILADNIFYCGLTGLKAVTIKFGKALVICDIGTDVLT